MEIGVSMPRIPDGPGLREFAQAAEAMGFESVLIGDHIVLPTGGTTQYPYTPSGGFSRPADEPFLETMTLLGYLAACTERIKLGSTVLILPYRNPVVQAKMFASLDSLTGGRMICGVGVGWLEKEFDTLGVCYAERGPLTDEFLEIFRTLWYDDQPEHHGKRYDFDGIQFYPKPVQNPLPIWVGGHTRAALRRTAKYGDCWHTTRQTPEFVASHIPYLSEQIEKQGRSVDDITVSAQAQPALHRHRPAGDGQRAQRRGPRLRHPGGCRRPPRLPRDRHPATDLRLSRQRTLRLHPRHGAPGRGRASRSGPVGVSQPPTTPPSFPRAPSFPRKQESMRRCYWKSGIRPGQWIPAFAGMTALGTISAHAWNTDDSWRLRRACEACRLAV